MKKVFAFVAVALFCTNIFAQNCKLNNPTDANGYIVLWDCANDDFAESNNFMPGQTVTLAFDVTGSVWETAIQGSAPEGTTLIPAIHMWFDIVKNGDSQGSGDCNPEIERLMQIRDNIYGFTINLAQVLDAKSAGNGAKAIVNGTDLWARAEMFIANYKNADGTPGDVWNQERHTIDYGAGFVLFNTLQSDGSAMDAAFTGASYTPAMFINDQAGYAAPCGTTATELPTNIANKKAPKFIENGNLYFLSNGVKYNALGTAIAK